MGFKPGSNVSVLDVVEEVLMVAVEERRVALSIGDASLIHVTAQEPQTVFPTV